MNHHTPQWALRLAQGAALLIAFGCWCSFAHQLGASWHDILVSPWHSLVYNPLGALQAGLRAIS